jgi:LysR family transcriptional regulator, transcriptional activator of the cysJI operon
MQIETFKIFCDLAETGSFSKAAALNEITQSAVSQQIRALETRFKVSLVERGRRHFSLTPEGHTFLDAAREILSVYENLDSRLQDMRNVVTGELRIAAVYSIGLHEVPPTLRRFRSLFPDVEVEVEYRRSALVYVEVLNGNVDIGLVAFPSKRNGLQIEVFRQDRLVLICPPNHRLASRESVRLTDLDGEKFISFEVDLPTRKAVDKFLRDKNVAIRQVMEFDNIETVKRAVEIEDGISIVPESTVLSERKSGTLCAIEIVEPTLWRPLGILIRRNRSRSPALKKFIAMLKGEFQTDKLHPPASAPIRAA